MNSDNDDEQLCRLNKYWPHLDPVCRAYILMLVYLVAIVWALARSTRALIVGGFSALLIYTLSQSELFGLLVGILSGYYVLAVQVVLRRRMFGG